MRLEEQQVLAGDGDSVDEIFATAIELENQATRYAYPIVSVSEGADSLAGASTWAVNVDVLGDANPACVTRTVVGVINAANGAGANEYRSAPVESTQAGSEKFVSPLREANAENEQVSGVD